MDIKYNINARYEITGRIVDGVKVIGYILLNRLNNQKEIRYTNDVKSLAINKNIYNCSAQVYDGKIILKGINCKLSQLDKYDINGNKIDKQIKNNKKQNKPNIMIVGRIMDNRNIIAYVVKYIKDSQVREISLEKDKVIELASKGKIINATTQMLDGKIILRGLGDNLSKLPLHKA